MSLDAIDVDPYDRDPEERRPRTLLWMQSVLINNLNEVVPSAAGSTTPSTTAIYGNGNSNSARLMVLEHELRTGEYLGEDRFLTLSEIVSARIKYMVEGEEDDKYQFWIIKIPQSSQDERALVRVGGLDRREISFYTEILPTIKMWIDSRFLEEKLEFNIPCCMYGQYTRTLDETPVREAIDNILDSEYLLALEDLRPKDFGKRHFSVGMSIPEVMAVIKEIGKLHATTWAMQEITQDTFHWDTFYHWKSSSALYHILIERGLAILDDFLLNHPDPDASGIASRFRTKYTKSYLHTKLKSLISPSTSPSPTCLIHMDLWSENLLFRIKDEDRECKDIDEADVDVYIIDWQVVALGRPTHDLAILFLTSMTPESRRKNEKTFLKYYYEIFKSTAKLFGLVLPFEFEVIQKEYKDSRLLAALLAIGSIQIAMLEKSTRERLFEVLRDLMNDDLI